MTKFSDINYTYFNFRVRECPADYPYYYVETQLCYTQCPAYCYLNTTYNFCYLCGYTCATCPNASFCQTCDPSMFRVMNTSTHKCDCMPGYFDTGVMQCQSCSKGCTKCTSATTCVTCNTTGGYSLSAGACVCGGAFYVDDDGDCVACSS